MTTSLFRSSLTTACVLGIALSTLSTRDLAAQAGSSASPTSAEKQLREAFWQQASGAGDAVVQLGFKQAVDAPGPSSIRARALWLLAQHEMDHGRKESAIRSLERLSVEFPGEGVLLASARRALADWTRADVSLSFEEWDRKRKSSPEFFERLVSRIEALATEKSSGERRFIRSSILAMGPAAIPALQSAAAGGQSSLAREATLMLFQLKSVPPAIALLRSSDWLTSSTAWSRLMALGDRDRTKLRDEMRKYRPTAATPFLQWLTQSGQSLPEFLHGTDWPSELLHDFEDIAIAIYAGMNPHERPGIASLARAQHVSPEIRRGLEKAALEFDWPGATAEQWIAWGQKALDLEGMIGAGWRAARCLRRDEFGPLQKLIELTREIPRDYREEYLMRIYESLGEVPNPTEVPINRDVLASMLDQLEFCAPERFFVRASNQDRFVHQLVETLFGTEKYLRMFSKDRSIGELLVIDEAGSWARSRRFVNAAFDCFEQRFEGWSEARRRLALRTLAQEETMIELAGTVFEARLAQLGRKLEDPSIKKLLEPAEPADADGSGEPSDKD